MKSLSQIADDLLRKINESESVYIKSRLQRAHDHIMDAADVMNSADLSDRFDLSAIGMGDDRRSEQRKSDRRINN